ncbi:WD40/YVTN/BNR-like repeat-containing protein [Alicyclobacillus mengziensis]|uniref:Photosynthesis system II assembly factor Ycf48/Hcf136-like domain-containing protein n=1 Tax=Alicyclobacillus mengziensis TaxID=2931921 RepID=A0A9X7W1C6_9BACL|nr:hypothetical protein [Alicyclobacillus mengziensis]QSO48637.1 hypothetical protein JZ786_06615 [Alicyclobacillus mengziensis]
MKNVVLLSSVVATTIFLLAGCASPSSKPQPSPTGSRTTHVRDSNTPKNPATQGVQISQQNATGFSSIHMVSPTTGWATGNGAVWHTTDGAITWENVTPREIRPSSKLQTYSYSFSKNHFWLAVTTDTQTAVQIYRTSDGGQTWNMTQIHDVGYPMHLSFTDVNHGWLSLMQGAAAGSERESIYQTNNAGETWNKISYTNEIPGGTLPFEGDKTGANFVNTQHGWATGFSPVSGQVYLFQTRNDGHTWKSQNVPVPLSLHGSQFTSHPPIFFNQTDGILTVQVNAIPAGFLVYQTTNGGKSWEPSTLLMGTTRNAVSSTWDFVAPNVGFVTDGAKLFMTDNGGQAWIILQPNISLKGVNELDFITQTDGWALTTSGFLYHTTDGGYTWTKVH